LGHLVDAPPPVAVGHRDHLARAHTAGALEVVPVITREGDAIVETLREHVGGGDDLRRERDRRFDRRRHVVRGDRPYWKALFRRENTPLSWTFATCSPRRAASARSSSSSSDDS